MKHYLYGGEKPSRALNKVISYDNAEIAICSANCKLEILTFLHHYGACANYLKCNILIYHFIELVAMGLSFAK